MIGIGHDQILTWLPGQAKNFRNEELTGSTDQNLTQSVDYKCRVRANKCQQTLIINDGISMINYTGHATGQVKASGQWS